MNKKDINTLILVGLLIFLVWLLSCIFRDNTDEGFNKNVDNGEITVTGKIKGLAAEANFARPNGAIKGDRIAITVDFGPALETNDTGPDTVKVSLLDIKDKSMTLVDESNNKTSKKKWVYEHTITQDDVTKQGGKGNIKVKISAESTQQGSHKIDGLEKELTNISIEEDKIFVLLLDSKKKTKNTQKTANVGDILFLDFPSSMLKSKSDDDIKKIKLKFLFGDSARPNDGDIKPDDQEGEEGDDSIKFYYTITKDDVNGPIKYSITDIKDVDNIGPEETPFKLEAKKADQKFAKYENYKKLLNHFEKLASSDKVFNDAVKELWPEYVAVEDVKKNVVCTNKAEQAQGCTLENEINWNIVLTLCSLIVSNKQEGFGNIIEGFDQKTTIYLLDVNTLIDGLKDLTEQTVLQNIKNILRWKKIPTSQNTDRSDGEISYVEGEWKETIGNNKYSLKDTRNKEFYILGPVNKRNGRTIDIFELLNVFDMENPSDDITNLQLATHLFIDQPISIRAHKYVIENISSREKNIKENTKEILVNVGALPESDCFTGVGANYSGHFNKYISPITGKLETCENWDSKNIPFGKDAGGGKVKHEGKGFGHSDYRKGGKYHHLVKKNYCRNPNPKGITGEGPWCYTKEEGLRYAYCNIKQCSGNQEPRHKPKSVKVVKSDCKKRNNEENILLKKKLKIINTILRKENKVLDDKIVRLYKTLEGTRN